MQQNNWFVLTGGPSTGKTTLQAALQEQGYRTMPEIPRLIIDEAVTRGISAAELRRDEQAFQESIARRRIEVEAALDPREKFIFDRGTMDTLAYLRYYDFSCSDELMQACEQAGYAKVFLLDPLPVYEADYARTEDAAFAPRIQELLYDAYDEYDMTPIIVPPLSIDERVAFVMEHIRTTPTI